MLARKIALNTIISSVARVLGTFISLATIGFITRYLDRAGWGEYSIISVFGGIFAVLADLGLYQVLVREISREGADENRIINNIFSLRLFGGLLIFAFAPLASLLFPYSSQLRWGILIGMIGFWLLNDIQVLVGVFQKRLRIDKIAIGELLGKLVQLGFIYLFIVLKFDFLWIAATISFGAFANFAFVLFSVKKIMPIKLEFDWPFWLEIWRKSYFLAISNILVTIYFSANALIISIFHPPDDVGIFRLSYKVLESLIFFPAMFAGLAMPLLSRAAHNDWPNFKKIFQIANNVLIITGIPLVLGGIVLSPRIIELLGGPNFPESMPVLAILMIAVGFIFFGTLFSYVLIALDKSRSLMIISSIGVILNLVLNFLFIPRYSYDGAAAITVLTEGLVTMLMAVSIFKIIGYLPSFKAGVKVLFASLIMAAAIWEFREQNVLILLIGGSLIYFCLLFLLKGISTREIKEILAPKEAQN
ncbi:MAG: Membrane protein involved in the export of O-antigen and teichoic acid [Parcubacteria group bacterium GW2011_GWC1_43_12]|nr:MAG: Membrane protein involved in the export of O-antigen and teichoic acid [Parcubacteria group bacterium GW2011_GWB1_42_6]KKS91741.1 MAG: Membrane protein involved in the export of O-antigen and teichoic acid [Parcubacteria group bacterium GW2011_GWC1_43_12]